MNCLIDGDDTYDIYLDREKIFKLRSKMIKKFSVEVQHYESKYEINPRELYDLRSDPVFKNACCLDYERARYEHVYTYSDYQYPSIVYLINEILKGDVDAVKRLNSINARETEDVISPYYKELGSYVRLVKKGENVRLNTVSSDGKFKSLVKKIIGKK